MWFEFRRGCPGEDGPLVGHRISGGRVDLVLRGIQPQLLRVAPADDLADHPRSWSGGAPGRGQCDRDHLGGRRYWGRPRLAVRGRRHRTRGDQHHSVRGSDLDRMLNPAKGTFAIGAPSRSRPAAGQEQPDHILTSEPLAGCRLRERPPKLSSRQPAGTNSTPGHTGASASMVQSSPISIHIAVPNGVSTTTIIHVVREDLKVSVGGARSTGRSAGPQRTNLRGEHSAATSTLHSRPATPAHHQSIAHSRQDLPRT